MVKAGPDLPSNRKKNELKFDKPYLVSMAAISGDSNSVGSQFFITTKKAPHLDNEYTVMGEVVQGFEIVDQISQVPRDAIMRPLKPIKLIRVTVE
jgi:cyclophilin family peptidyl-prolyl cis-trans isomerase